MKRILIVDDSIIVIEACRMALEEAGFEVETMLQEDGLSMNLPVAEIDLILMDVNLPTLYGDSLTKLLRGRGALDVPVYLFSDKSENELKRRVTASGANGYICKSWGMDVLVDRVKNILNVA